MTKASFVQYLQHPELIATAPLVEIEALANQYPYSTNAQVLLALYAELSLDPRREALFARAATMTFDRGHLYDLFSEIHQPQPPEEESLELLPLEEIGTVEPVLLGADFSPTAGTLPYPDLNQSDDNFTGAADQQPAIPSFDEVDPWDYSEQPLVEDTELPDQESDGQRPDPEPNELEEETVQTPDIASSSEEEASPTEAEPLEPTTQSTAGGQLVPRPPSAFVQRKPIATREELRRRLQLIRQRQTERVEEGPAVKKVARRSLVVSDGAISSTLAEVFKEQGQYQHAIRVYEQLALANPEKRPIFAALIQDLKRKIP